jgi:hypothetical protein
VTAPLTHPEVEQAEVWDGFLSSLFSHKTETQLWLESPRVSAWCRAREVERLEGSGVVVGGTA